MRLLVVVALLPLSALAQTGVDMGPSECFSCRDAPAAPPPSNNPNTVEQQRELAAEQARLDKVVDAERANLLGLEAQQQGNWDKAIAAFEAALKGAPNNADYRDNLALARQGRARAEMEQRKLDAIRESNRAIEQKLTTYQEQVARPALASLNASLQASTGGRLQLLNSAPGPLSPVECSAIVAEGEATQRWSDEQAHAQGWSFLADASGISGAAADAKAAALEKAGAKPIEDALKVTRARLAKAEAFKAFMARVDACVRGTGKTDCLVALAAEEGQEPAKQWLKGLLDKGTKDAAERADQAGKIYQQYVQRLEGAARKQALAATTCR